MNRQQGFTFVELVIVVVILGLLAATALPKFIDISDDAERAATEGVAGGFASAVGITRAQWEVDFRPLNSVVVDGTNVGINEFGYPSGANNQAPNSMSAANCQTVFNSILQSPPLSVTTGDARDSRYFVTVQNSAGGSAIAPDGTTVNNLDLCTFHAVSSLDLNTNGVPTGTAPTDGRGFTYNAGTGQVISFTNG